VLQQDAEISSRHDSDSSDEDFVMGDADGIAASDSDSDVWATPDESSTSTQPQQNRIFKALDGRPYNEWHENGKASPTYGALLPSGYLKHKNPKYPWICPVDTCQNMFEKMSGLGGHFNVGDQQDWGTLDILLTRTPGTT
jgi:hypothetical protein